MIEAQPARVESPLNHLRTNESAKPVATPKPKKLTGKSLVLEQLETPEHLSWKQLRFTIAFGLLLIHAVAAVGFWFFSWSGLFIALGLYVMTIPLGISIGFHRLLTHRSFESPTWLTWVCGLTGTLAMQAGPVTWVAAHRLHHSDADRQPDPHSPFVSFMWSHLFWFLFWDPRLQNVENRNRLAKDVVARPGQLFLEDNYWWINLLMPGVLFGLGWLVGGFYMAMSWMTWGWALRLVAGWHATFFVNSACHLWGYRNYDIVDNSRNNWWVALLTFGEGWHNNHHADPSSAAHGHRLTEIDPAYMFILGLQKLGIVKNVRRPSHTERMVHAKGDGA